MSMLLCGIINHPKNHCIDLSKKDNLNTISFNNTKSLIMNKKYLLLTIVISLLSYSVSFSQSPDTCKVLLEKISEEYKGKCLNGLAEGKGTAKGEDIYTGLFKNGLPEGKGKYIYKNGNIYKGYWKNGHKDGKGEFKYYVNGKKHTLKGYWENDEYVGTTDPEISYSVNTSSGIMQYEVKKIDGQNNEIIFYITSAMTKFVPIDLKVDISSGQIVQTGKKFEINHFFSPFNCDISYSIKMGDSRKQCHFKFDILEKGSYKIILHND